MRRTFAKLDVDNSGYIDAEELVSFILLQAHIIRSVDGSTAHSFNVQWRAEGVKSVRRPDSRPVRQCEAESH